MSSSYGLIEVSGIVAAINSLDAMCKAADVSLVTWERKLGGRLVTIIVEGDVSDVKSAVEAADRICRENAHILASSGIIAAPCQEIRRLVARSASRLQKKREDVPELLESDGKEKAGQKGNEEKAEKE